MLASSPRLPVPSSERCTECCLHGANLLIHMLGCSFGCWFPLPSCLLSRPVSRASFVRGDPRLATLGFLQILVRRTGVASTIASFLPGLVAGVAHIVVAGPTRGSAVVCGALETLRAVLCKACGDKHRQRCLHPGGDRPTAQEVMLPPLRACSSRLIPPYSRVCRTAATPAHVQHW